MYNMSMFHSLLLNEKYITGIGHLRGLLLLLLMVVVVVVWVGGEGGVGLYLNERSSMYNKIKFRNQRRHPIYILVNRFLLYGGIAKIFNI